MQRNFRVFICADVDFPRASAGANRIHYLAKALQESGNDIYIFSCGKLPLDENADGFGDYYGLSYKNINNSTNKFKRIFNRKFFVGFKILEFLKQMSPTQQDVVILYGSNSFFVEPIVKYCVKNNVKTYIDVVEWHQPFQYKFGKLDPRYISNDRTFTKLALKAGNVISISELINEYYMSHGCNTEVFPIMIDSLECEKVNSNRSNKERVNFIYPGNPMAKDDFCTMIKGIAMLDKESQNKMLFHVTGVREEVLRTIMGSESYLLDSLNHCIKLHGWMDFNELVSLYADMDFLYMSRPDNVVTRANFPSKMPELMAYGVVPIGTKVGDYYKYLTDGSDSILFKENTENYCAEALIRALSLSKEELRTMREKAKKTAEINFDYRRWISRLTGFVNNDE